MAKTLAIVILLFLLALLLPTAEAQGVSVSLAAKDLTAYTGTTSEMNVTITNTGGSTEQFTIDIWPPYWEGISVVPEYPRLTIPSGGSSSLKLYFSIPIDTNEQRVTYNITVKSVTTPLDSSVQIMDLWVMRSVPIYISDLNVDKYSVDPTESFNIETSVTNAGNDPYTESSIETKIMKNGELVDRLETGIDEISKKTTVPVDIPYSFGKYAEPGIYTIRSDLKDSINRVVSSMEATVKLKPVYNITIEKAINYGILLQTINIRVTNEGNTANSTIISEIMPAGMSPFVFPAGATSRTTDNMVSYNWFIQDLAPGQSRTVSYQINLWSAWAIVLIMLLAVMFAFNLVYVPGIAKTFKHTGPITREKAIQIMLEARNRSIHEIRDVIVRDFVPSIAKVVDKFDTVKPSLIRRVGSGTELIWKFDSLNPREERVLTYWIIPSVDIPSSLKLSKAFMRFVDKKRVKKVSTSKSVLVTSG